MNPRAQHSTRRRLVCAGLLLAMGNPARAADLGTFGPTYPIEETDLLALIRERLLAKERSGELARLMHETRARVIDEVNHPAPVDGLAPTQVARTFYVDPSFTLTENVLDAQGHVLFPAGTRRNPLEVVSMSKHLLFFDAREANQVARAAELIRTYGGRVKPILVGGSYLALMRQWQAPVYYDQGGALVRRLGIRHVPALVSQEGLRLRVDEVLA